MLSAQPPMMPADQPISSVDLMTDPIETSEPREAEVVKKQSPPHPDDEVAARCFAEGTGDKDLVRCGGGRSGCAIRRENRESCPSIPCQPIGRSPVAGSAPTGFVASVPRRRAAAHLIRAVLHAHQALKDQFDRASGCDRVK